MAALEFHRRVVLGGKPLQQHGGTRIELVAGATVRMQLGDAAAVGLLEFIQAATGVQAQSPVHLEKVGLVCHAFPFVDDVAICMMSRRVDDWLARNMRLRVSTPPQDLDR
jgi:hypothetical protein